MRGKLSTINHIHITTDLNASSIEPLVLNNFQELVNDLQGSSTAKVVNLSILN